jgi:hypothetical protein
VRQQNSNNINFLILFVCSFSLLSSRSAATFRSLTSGGGTTRTDKCSRRPSVTAQSRQHDTMTPEEEVNLLNQLLSLLAPDEGQSMCTDSQLEQVKMASEDLCQCIGLESINDPQQAADLLQLSQDIQDACSDKALVCPKATTHAPFLSSSLRVTKDSWSLSDDWSTLSWDDNPENSHPDLHENVVPSRLGLHSNAACEFEAAAASVRTRSLLDGHYCPLVSFVTFNDKAPSSVGSQCHQDHYKRRPGPLLFWSTD